MLQSMIPPNASQGSCLIETRDTYYVYVLRSPYGVPFYVGKGKNHRVNDHFSPRSLQPDNLKNRAINKFGATNCYREIVSYLDSEDAAYELEDFIMEQTGCILDKNGPLTNIYRPGYPSRKYETKNGLEYRDWLKYSDDLVFKFYVMEFELCVPRTLIKDELGIGVGYQLSLANGTSRTNLYKKYVASGYIQNNKKSLNYNPRTPVKRDQKSDLNLLIEYDHVINGRKTIKEASENLDLIYGTVWRIFKGDTRKYLQLDYKRDLKVPLKGNTRKYDREKAIRLIKEGVSSNEFIEKMSCSYGYYHYIKELVNDWSIE